MKNKNLGLLNLSLILGSIGGAAYLYKKKFKLIENLFERYKSYYNLTNQWLLNKNKDKNVGQYFKDYEYKTIAIYGMGTLAEIFYEELKKGSDIEVAYFIDKNSEQLYYGIDDIPLVNLDDLNSQNKVDAIIVTPTYDFRKISKELEGFDTDAAIISLEDIIYEL